MAIMVYFGECQNVFSRHMCSVLVLHQPLKLLCVACLGDDCQVAREGFCSQIRRLSNLERETSICINREVDLAKTALYIAAEDDSLVSHSSVPLPVDDFIQRLYDVSMGYCSYYNSYFKFSPEKFLESLERYLYTVKVCSFHY